MKTKEEFEELFRQEEYFEQYELAIGYGGNYKYSDTQDKYKDYLEGRYPYVKLPDYIEREVSRLVLCSSEFSKLASDYYNRASEIRRGKHWDTIIDFGALSEDNK